MNLTEDRVEPMCALFRQAFRRRTGPYAPRVQPLPFSAILTSMGHITSELFSFFADSLTRPEIDSDQSTRALWTDPHISAQMLRFHLDPDNDAASYRHEVIDRAVDWMYRHFELDEASRCLDLGCGPGLYTQRMAELGVDVTGIDFSERSLRHAATRAAERGIEIAYRHESYLESELTTQADLITMISCDMSALTPESRAQLLGNVSRWLSTDGAFVFDFHSTVRFSEARERHSLSPGVSIRDS